jgi:hypothetical protein
VTHEPIPSPEFPGFPDFQANVTFVPLQFFTAVLPYASRGTVRLVGYALRKVLGWVDAHGQPIREQLQFTYRELIEQAGVARDSIVAALDEAIERRCLRCVQRPQPDALQQPGRSGIYELCWDETGAYTDVPETFAGFYFPEAALVEERQGATTIRRPKAARKNIPNAFFDHLLPRERLSVARVVGALLFYSIQWGPGGERRQPVSCSITELSRLTKFSRQHVHEAVLEALQRGYIERVKAGYFDPAAAQASRAATYGIRWAAAPAVAAGLSSVSGSESPSALPNAVRKSDRSEKVNGAPVGKGVRDRSEKVNGERSEKVNDIRIKRDLKTETTAAGSARPPLEPKPAAAESVIAQLRETGFDETVARRLAARCPPEVITRQIDWLPLRNSTQNRLGLLRRAIEQDWPKPEGAVEDQGQQSGREFASHYYAAYHGYTGEARTEPFARDVQAAARFVERLLAQQDDAARVPEWGRQFGGVMRQRHHGEAKARPNLSCALVLYGDEFLRRVASAHSARSISAHEKAHAARHAALSAEYQAYLRLAEIDAQRTAPALYGAFAQERQRTRNAMTGGLFQATAETLAKFDRDESRLLSFAECFHRHPQTPVLDFEQWDKRRVSHDQVGTAATGGCIADITRASVAGGR